MTKPRKVILTIAASVAGLALGLSVPAALATGADTNPTDTSATDTGASTAPVTTADPATTTAPPAGNDNQTAAQVASQIATLIQSSTANCNVSVDASDNSGTSSVIVNVTCISLNQATIAQNICQVQVQAPVANSAIGCNVIGPSGPMGPQGAQGPQGQRGAPGATGPQGPEIDVCLNWPRDGLHNNPTEIMKLTGKIIVLYQTNTGLACVSPEWVRKVKLAAKLKAQASQKTIVKVKIVTKNSGKK